MRARLRSLLVERFAGRDLAAAARKRADLVRFYESKLDGVRGELDAARADSMRLRERVRHLSERIDQVSDARDALRRQLEAVKDLPAVDRSRALGDPWSLVTRHEHGSLTPGIEAWAARWREDRPRVVLFATKDYAGSFFAWARAINAHTDWAARLVTVRPHQFGYDNDLAFGAPQLVDDRLDELVGSADVVHVKDERGFLDRSNGLPADLLRRHGLPMVSTQYGSLARASQFDEDYRRYVRTFDAVVAITPDLCFDWAGARFVPHAVDVSEVPSTWRDGDVVAHAPTTRGRKGTQDLVRAVERLDGALQLDLIEGVPHAECIERMSRAAVFFDQAGREPGAPPGARSVIGWYGNAALEAAARGIPTIAHLAPHAFEGAARGGHDIEDRCGIITTERGADGIERTLRGWLETSQDERRARSEAARAWVSAFHGASVVGPQLTAVYDAIRDR